MRSFASKLPVSTKDSTIFGVSQGEVVGCRSSVQGGMCSVILRLESGLNKIVYLINFRVECTKRGTRMHYVTRKKIVSPPGNTVNSSLTRLNNISSNHLPCETKFPQQTRIPQPHRSWLFRLIVKPYSPLLPPLPYGLAPSAEPIDAIMSVLQGPVSYAKTNRSSPTSPAALSPGSLVQAFART